MQHLGRGPGRLEGYECALAAAPGWRSDAEAQRTLALQETPTFVQAHVLQALLPCSRDPRFIRSAARRLRIVPLSIAVQA